MCICKGVCAKKIDFLHTSARSFMQHVVTSSSRERRTRAWSNAPLSSRRSVHTLRFCVCKSASREKEKRETVRKRKEEKKWPPRRRTRGRNLVEKRHMGEGEERSREGTRPPEAFRGPRGWSEVTPPCIRLQCPIGWQILPPQGSFVY